jgi:hypothetical protein
MTAFFIYLHFVVDYVTRVAYGPGTIQNCALTTAAAVRAAPMNRGTPSVPKLTLKDTRELQ